MPEVWQEQVAHPQRPKNHHQTAKAEDPPPKEEQDTESHQDVDVKPRGSVSLPLKRTASAASAPAVRKT